MNWNITNASALTPQQLDPYPGARGARPAELRYEGTFGGATLSIESALAEGGEYVPHPDSVMTAPGVVVLWLVPGTWIRPARSGAGGTTNVSLTIR